MSILTEIHKVVVCFFEFPALNSKSYYTLPSTYNVRLTACIRLPTSLATIRLTSFWHAIHKGSLLLSNCSCCPIRHTRLATRFHGSSPNLTNQLVGVTSRRELWMSIFDRQLELWRVPVKRSAKNPSVGPVLTIFGCIMTFKNRCEPIIWFLALFFSHILHLPLFPIF